MNGTRSLGICRTVGDLKRALNRVPDAIPLDVEHCTEVEVIVSSVEGFTIVNIEPYDDDVDVFDTVQIDGVLHG